MQNVGLVDFVFLVLGAALGVLGSLAAWWITVRFFSPQIDFSEEVSKRPSKAYSSGWLYRIKFKNARKRKAIDVTVIVRVAIYEIGLDKTWNWYVVPTQVEAIPVLTKGANRLVILRPYLGERFKESVFPQRIKDKVDDGSLVIEDLLDLGTKAFLRVYVSAFDEFSGNRKMFLSKKYTAADIRKGDFNGLDVVGFRRTRPGET